MSSEDRLRTEELDAPLVPATTRHVWRASSVMTGVILDAPQVARAQVTPGQYVRVVVDSDCEGHLALAQPPGSEHVELLVRDGGPFAERLTRLRPGDPLQLSLPLGDGFPIERHRGRDLILLAAGSGIAPLRAVLHVILADRAAWGDVRLYYGQRGPEEFAYAREAAIWRAGGVFVEHVLSGESPGWLGMRGWVQHAVKDGPPVSPDAVVYLCGMKAMLDEARQVLRELGVGAERVYVNL